MSWPRVPLPVAISLGHLTRSGGESEFAVGVSLFAPFYESEQLGSHAAPSGLNVETDQPQVWPPMVSTRSAVGRTIAGVVPGSPQKPSLPSAAASTDTRCMIRRSS
jgi:hypothetical protein